MTDAPLTLDQQRKAWRNRNSDMRTEGGQVAARIQVEEEVPAEDLVLTPGGPGPQAVRGTMATLVRHVHVWGVTNPDTETPEVTLPLALTPHEERIPGGAGDGRDGDGDGDGHGALAGTGIAPFMRTNDGDGDGDGHGLAPRTGAPRDASTTGAND